MGTEKQKKIPNAITIILPFFWLMEHGALDDLYIICFGFLPFGSVSFHSYRLNDASSHETIFDYSSFHFFFIIIVIMIMLNVFSCFVLFCLPCCQNTHKQTIK